MEAERAAVERRVVELYARIIPLLSDEDAVALQEAVEADEASPRALAALHHLWAHARSDERAALIECDGPRFWLSLEESDEGDERARSALGGGDGDSGCGA